MSNPTIYDVSRLSGYSIATVSRAFSEPNRVREATRRKIYEAAEAINYHPSAIARAMAMQQTDKIAFIICKEGAAINDEFYSSICVGVMGKANELEYQIIISTAEEWKRMPQRKQIDGAILAGDASPDLISEILNQDVKVVTVNHVPTGFDVPSVVADEEDGVFQVIQHLVEEGHVNISMIAGRFSAYITSRRYRAFIEASRKFNLPVDESNIVMCGTDIESATEAAFKLLNKPTRPTAVFAFNDIIAAGVMKAARKHGLGIPNEISVVGFDNSSVCTLLEPELSSVYIDCQKMGELCVEHMDKLITGQGEAERNTVVPTKLVKRASSMMQRQACVG